jgi:hypothetical protein
MVFEFSEKAVYFSLLQRLQTASEADQPPRVLAPEDKAVGA